eukprot:CAMPEP_0182468360 /NCGR_PEP_ID=MMETSP1319-20130603/15379_1 /TAXON_ID=172717 /ORGANISM="Bolidomonas pacifica, Strain RCC208" /LENGTH=203 /DNA_ID=CAMNT_0024668549 /DNA_START=52 /DNA_END=660 /DNA_ORIENTATION=+
MSTFATAPSLPPPSEYNLRSTINKNVEALRSSHATTFATLALPTSLLTFGTNGVNRSDLSAYLSSPLGPSKGLEGCASGLYYDAALRGDRVFAASSTGVDVFSLQALLAADGDASASKSLLTHPSPFASSTECNGVAVPSEGGSIYAAGGDTFGVYVFDVEKGFVRNVGKNSSYLHCVSHDDSTLAWGGEDGDVAFADVRSAG